MKPRIHITAVASPARAELERLTAGLDRPPAVEDLVALAQQAAGDGFAVTANADLITAEERDRAFGRDDDAARAADVEAALADDRVAALVTIRGGAWFERLLDRIDFDVLTRRRRPIYLFGFSEMTPLIAIAGQYPTAIGVHDLGPGFLFGGVKRHVQMNISRYARAIELTVEQHEAFAAGWAMACFRDAMSDFFTEVAGVIRGQPSPRVPSGRLLAGDLPERSTLRITGGNLSLLLPLMGTRYASAVDPSGKWLALEEVNESPEQCDRMFAGLKHNGLFARAEGIILGDFHDKQSIFTDRVPEILAYHLPAGRQLPIVRLDNFGHAWPIAPLVMHRELTLHCESTGNVRIETPWQNLAEGAK